MCPITTRRQVGRVHQALQAPDDALPDVEQHRGRVPLDEVARGRPRLVGRGRAAAEHGETEAARRVRGHRGHRYEPRRRRRATAARRPRCRRADRSALARMGARCSPRPRSSTRCRPSRSSPASIRGARASRRRHARAAVPARRGDLPSRRSRRRAVHHRQRRGEDLAAVRGRRRGDPRAAPARGDVFGELALLDGAPRSATATALDAGRDRRPAARPVPRADRRPSRWSATRCWRRSPAELRRLTTHVEELHFLDITGRLAARLVAPRHRRRDRRSPTGRSGCRRR